MVAEKIIAPVTEPTDWVSSFQAILKKDGSVRIFLDPKDLNNAILIAFCPLTIAHCPLLTAHCRQLRMRLLDLPTLKCSLYWMPKVVSGR